MLVFGGLIGYTAISSYNKFYNSKKILDNVNTNDYKHIYVIYKPIWLCPYVKSTVIGFKDNYISENEKYKMLNKLLTSDNPNEIINKLKEFKSDTIMTDNAIKLATNNNSESSNDANDGVILNETQSWVLPNLLPWKIDLIYFKRNENNLNYNRFTYLWDNSI
jgi:hypothetical protein